MTSRPACAQHRAHARELDATESLPGRRSRNAERALRELLRAPRARDPRGRDLGHRHLHRPGPAARPARAGARPRHPARQRQPRRVKGMNAMSKLKTGIVAAGVLLALAVGVSYAAIPSANGTISACVK